LWAKAASTPDSGVDPVLQDLRIALAEHAKRLGKIVAQGLLEEVALKCLRAVLALVAE